MHFGDGLLNIRACALLSRRGAKALSRGIILRSTAAVSLTSLARRGRLAFPGRLQKETRSFARGRFVRHPSLPFNQRYTGL